MQEGTLRPKHFYNTNGNFLARIDWVFTDADDIVQRYEVAERL